MSSIFFFSSRRRHTRWNCDWSSDVCSSDLDDQQACSQHRLPFTQVLLTRLAHVYQLGIQPDAGIIEKDAIVDSCHVDGNRLPGRKYLDSFRHITADADISREVIERATGNDSQCHLGVDQVRGNRTDRTVSSYGCDTRRTGRSEILNPGRNVVVLPQDVNLRIRHGIADQFLHMVNAVLCYVSRPRIHDNAEHQFTSSKRAARGTWAIA